jgi:hypothetical protein
MMGAADFAQKAGAVIGVTKKTMKMELRPSQTLGLVFDSR